MADDTTTNEVPLLAGGNPQVPKGDGDGPVQAYIAAMPDWKGEVGRHLDDLIDEVVPDVRKAVRWNTPFYGVEGNGWFLSVHCFTEYVKVTWLNCAHLDPAPPVASKNDRVRSLHITADDIIDDDQLEDWIRQAADAPGDDTF